jgi:acetolactate synthase-1/2/3 large subunit
VLAALSESKTIKFVNTRHEQIAAPMADGYARAKHKTAGLLSHLGPGLTNASTGVANAALDSVSMVVIAGDVPSHRYGKHPHQEVNLHADAAHAEIYRRPRHDRRPGMAHTALPLAASSRSPMARRTRPTLRLSRAASAWKA